MEARSLTSEWADWTDSNLPDLDALAERQRYEGYVAGFWREVKASIVAAVNGVNSRLPDVRRVECADSPTGGLALTRWSDYPVAFLDISVDVDSGMIGCLYSFAERDGDAYDELHSVWLMRAVDGGLAVTDEHGRPVSSSADLARQIVDAYVAHL